MTWKNWRGDLAKQIATKAGLAALRDVGETVLTTGMNTVPLAPDGGTLRRSGTVTVGALPDGASVYAAAEGGQNMKDAFKLPVGNEKAVYISYSTPYARKVHELPSESNWSEPGTGPKFLENAVNKQKPKAPDYVEKKVREALRRAR
jgi:hypothetical protein